MRRGAQTCPLFLSTSLLWWDTQECGRHRSPGTSGAESETAQRKTRKLKEYQLELYRKPGT